MKIASATSALAILLSVGVSGAALAQTRGDAIEPPAKPAMLALMLKARPVPRPANLVPAPAKTTNDVASVQQSEQIVDLDQAATQKLVTPEAVEVVQSNEPTTAIEAPVIETPVAPVITPSDNLFAAVDGDKTYPDQQAQESEDLQAVGTNQAQADAQLKAMKQMVSQGRYHEAYSAAGEIQPAYLSSEGVEDLIALYYVAGLLREPRITETGEYPLTGEKYENWPDADVWSAIHLILNEDVDAAKDGIPAASDRILATYSPALQRDLIPTLLEAAILTSEWTAAKSLAQRLIDDESLRKGGSYDFLLGLAAEMTDRPLDAFDAYRKAAEGSDVYAQRARIAIVDIGLATRAMTNEEASKILNEVAYFWIGDQYEVEAFKRLADVEMALGNDVAALTALARISFNHPESEDYSATNDQITKLLNAVYSGVEADGDLGPLLEKHVEIAQKLKFYPGFSGNNTDLAILLGEAGLTARAVDELSKIMDYLSTGKDMGILDPEGDEIANLIVLKAGYEYDRRKYEAAAQTLAALQLDAIEDPSLAENARDLMAKVYSVTDKPEQVLTTVDAMNTPDKLRLIAEAQFATQEWEQAKINYLALKQIDPEHFTVDDAINLALSAYRSADLALIPSIAEDTPAVVGKRDWREIALGLSLVPAPLSPLSSAAAKARVAQADQTLEELKAVVE